MKKRENIQGEKPACFRKVRQIALFGGLFVLFGVAIAMACGWSYITDHSVRFNSHRTGRAFYRLPPLPIMFDRKTGKELSVNDRYDDENNLDGPTRVNNSTL